MSRHQYRPALMAGAVLAAILSVAGPAAAASGPGLGTIIGRINGPSGGPVSHVSVTAVNVGSGGSSGPTAQTRADGSYEIDNITPGAYKLRVSIPSQTQWAHQKLTSADADVFDIAADQTTTIDETMLAPGKITVSATDSVTGQPIGQFCASVNASTLGTCVTDPGTVTLTNLATGTYRVNVWSADGLHARTQLTGVQVALGQTTPVTASLAPAGAIAVTVNDSATGAPVGHACVALLRTGFNDNGPQNCPTHTDNAGHATIGELPAGTFDLFVAPNDGIHGFQWVGWHGGTGDQSAAIPFEVTPGQLTVAPTVLADPVGSITGTITDATTGLPIDNSTACATVLPNGLPRDVLGGRVCTDDTGRYSIAGVGPYRWPVQYTTNGNINRAWQWAGGVANRFDSHRVKVAAGGATTADFTAVTGGVLTGHLLNPDGSPFFGSATIRAFNAVTGDVAAGVASASFDGSYTIVGLTTQDIKLQVSALSIQGVPMSVNFGSSPSIAVRLGEDLTYDVVLDPIS